MPVPLLLLIGAIDLGRLSQFDTMLASSARAGAQYGSLNLVTADDLSGMKTAATNDVSNMSGIVVTASASNFCKCADGTSTTCTGNACSSNHRLLYVSVSASATFRPLFHYFVNTGAAARTRTAILEVGQ